MKLVPPNPSQPEPTKVKLGIGFGCCAAPMAVAPMTNEATNATPPIKTILDIANSSSVKPGRPEVRLLGFV